MLRALLTLLGCAVVVLVPGAAIARAVAPRYRFVTTVAVAPPLSMAFIYVLGEIAEFAGLPFGAPVFLAATASLVLMAIGRLILISPTIRDSLEPRGSVVLLAIGIFVGTVVWTVSVAGVATAPANHDGSIHGHFVANVVDQKSLQAGEVLRLNLSHRKPPPPSGTGQHFHQLGLHGAGALVHQMTGAPIGSVLILFPALVAAVVLPVGMYSLTKLAVPTRPWVGGFAALLTPTLAAFPYRAIFWGGLPLLVAMSLVPSVVVATVRAVQGGRTGQIAVSSLALVGLAFTHLTQIPIAVVLSVLVSIEVARSKGLKRIAALSLIAAFGAAPILVHKLASLAGAVLNRAGVVDTFKPPGGSGPLLANLAQLNFTDQIRQPIFAGVAFVGAIVCVYRREALSIVSAFSVVIALYLLAHTTWPLARWATLPWHQDAERIYYNLIFFLPPLAAMALDSFVDWIKGQSRSRGPLTVGALLFLGVSLLAQPAWAIARHARGAFADYAAIGENEVKAFRALAADVPENHTVINDLNVDGSLWMYAFSRVRPMFPYGFSADDERMFLVRHVHEFAHSQRVQELLVKYCVSHAYFDETGFGAPQRFMDLTALQSSSARQVYSNKGVHVFRLGTRCPTS